MSTSDASKYGKRKQSVGKKRPGAMNALVAGFKDLTGLAGGRSKIQPDDLLVSCEKQLTQLRDEIMLVRSQFTKWADAMEISCDLGSQLSGVVDQFYDGANHDGRKELLKSFRRAQEEIASSAFNTINGEITSEQGICAHLDEWLEAIKQIQSLIDDAQKARNAAETARIRLESIQDQLTKKKAQSGGSGLFSSSHTTEQELSELQHKITETSKVQESLSNDYQSSRKQVEKQTTKIMQDRFQNFDIIYVKILECQHDFYIQGNKQVKKYEKSINYYRTKYPKGTLNPQSMNSFGRQNSTRSNSGSGSHSRNASRTSPRKRGHKKNDSGSVSQPQIVMAESSQIDDPEDQPINFIGKRPKGPIALPSTGDSNSRSENIRQTEIKNLNKSQSQSDSQQVPNQVGHGPSWSRLLDFTTDELHVTDDNIDLPNGSTKTNGNIQNGTINNKTINNNNNNINNNNNNLDINDNDNEQTPKLNKVPSFDIMFGFGTTPPQQPQSQQIQQQRSTSQISQQSGIDFMEQISTPNNNNNNNNNNSDDIFGGFVGGSHGTKSTNSISMNDMKNGPMQHFKRNDTIVLGDLFSNDDDNGGNVNSTQSQFITAERPVRNDAASKSNPNIQLSKAQQQNADKVAKLNAKRMQEEWAEEKTQIAERHEALDKNRGILDSWEFDNTKGENQRRNVRTLLTTVQDITVLSDDIKKLWKPVKLSDLLGPKKVKKAKFKVDRVFHPDKSKNRGDSPAQAAICERIWQAITVAHKQEFGS